MFVHSVRYFRSSVEAVSEIPAKDKEPEEEILNKTVEQEELEEMYDYERDDTKEACDG